METVGLLAQIGTLSTIALWLLLGLRDNILYPEQNRGLTDLVLGMDLMEEEDPAAFAQIGHRRVTTESVRAAMFWGIVAAEAVVTLVMFAGLAALTGALFGWVDLVTARALALLGALGFTMIWTGFLVAGNHFGYWLCHKTQQFTHFHMTLWGLGTMIVIVSV